MMSRAGVKMPGGGLFQPLNDLANETLAKALALVEVAK